MTDLTSREAWVRLHCLPKICRRFTRLYWTPKQRWYCERSFERYMGTDDGKYMSEAVSKFLRNPEIGHYEGIRFVSNVGQA